MKFSVTLVSKKYENPLDSRGELKIDIEFEEWNEESAKGKCKIFEMHGFECKNLNVIQID